MVQPSLLQEVKKYSPDAELYDIVGVKQLKSISNDDYKYTLCALSPYGYAIVLNETNSLLEASYARDSVTPIPINTAGDVYYIGPCSFAIKQGDQYIDVMSESVLTDAALESIETIETTMLNYENEQAATEAELQAVTPPYYDREYDSGSAFFSTLSSSIMNTNGTCTTIAAAYLLHYYDSMVNTNFIDDAYAATIGSSGAYRINRSFYEVLCEYVFGTSTPAPRTIAQISSGVNSYLNSRDLSYEIRYVETNYYSQLYTVHNAIVTEIKSGMPAIASITTALMDNQSDIDEYGDHTLVVYGCTYREYSGIEVNSNEYDPNYTRAYQNLKFRCYYSTNSNMKDILLTSAWFNACGYLVTT